MTWDIEPDVPKFLTGDPHRLRQVLTNLAGNALKFTEKGEIALRVRVAEKTDNDVCLHFEIRDTGIGVEPHKQEVIFEAFAQADGSTTRKYGGTGLGLTITSQLVDLMGGKIWLESPSPIRYAAGGPGSVFSFSIHFGIAEVDNITRSDATDTVAARRRGLRILVAEDNRINQRLAVGILEKYGHTIELASNGKEALAAFERSPFDLILMDVQMPDLNGFEATRAIRAKDRINGKHTPIIAATAYALEGDRERCLAAGMDAYISKPIKPDELFRAIDDVITSGPNTKQIQGDATTESPELASLMDFTAGDRELTQKLIEIFLEDCPPLLGAICKAVESHDAAALGRAAHTMKGALGYFGASSASAAALRLQEMGANNDFAAAPQTLAALEVALETLTNALSQSGRVYVS
jgi:CheY-like chemotaxis protein